MTNPKPKQLAFPHQYATARIAVSSLIGLFTTTLLLAQPAISDGSFESGTNLAFTTAYTWTPPNGPTNLYTEGKMTIGPNPKLHHNAYFSFDANWGSQMLIVNAKPEANAIVWAQTVPQFIVGHQYRISVRARSTFNDGYAQLFWRVKNTPTATTHQQSAPTTLGPHNSRPPARYELPMVGGCLHLYGRCA